MSPYGARLPARRAFSFPDKESLAIKCRVACFVDGFNLYHAIRDLGPESSHLKWVDLRGLASAFITPSTEQLVSVFYFSAYATWLGDPLRQDTPQGRHREYVAALEARGTTSVLGKFKEKSRHCLKCGARWTTHEEKESDVNIALHLLHHAHIDSFDKAQIISSDSDLCPAIRLLKDHFPKKPVEVLVPPRRYDITREIDGLVTTRKIKRKHLARNLLPEIIYDSDGNTQLKRPAVYAPPGQAGDSGEKQNKRDIKS